MLFSALALELNSDPRKEKKDADIRTFLVGGEG